jgi:SP family general alpha glucoside:H+ symporter-like MFS transporter
MITRDHQRKTELGTIPTSDNAQDVIEVDTEIGAVGRLAATDPKFTVLSGEAKIATDAEHAMTVREAIRLYPKAVVWSLLLSSAVAMEGFDIVLISSFFAFPPFQRKYGELTPKGYQVSAPWQAGLSNAARVGEIMGLLLNGWFAERFGHVKTMVGSLALLTGFIFISFFAHNIQTLLAADLLMGIPWGAFQTLVRLLLSNPFPNETAINYASSTCFLHGALGLTLGPRHLHTRQKSVQLLYAHTLPRM